MYPVESLLFSCVARPECLNSSMVIETGNVQPNPPKSQAGVSSQNIDYGRKYAADIKREKLKQEKSKRGKFPILRKLAIIQSFILLLIVTVGIFACAINEKDTDKWGIIFLLSLVVVGQVFNVVVHWIDPSYQTTTWLGLYIVRKKLEEKNKIENLTSKK
ncbi:MAG TPA: hypothetical protein VGI63_08830 [Verrucomicrobiae bacterium]